MSTYLQAATLLAVLTAWPAVSVAQEGRSNSNLPPITEASIGATRQFDFKSAVNGASYRVQVYVPRRSPGSLGFPSLYVLDGNALFGTFANAVRTRGMAGEIEPAVVVGVSDGEGADRTYDFTETDMTAHEKSIVKDLSQPSRFGGAELFLRVLQEEIKPKVAALVHIDASRSALFGWSLGGLFVVRTMLTHPDAFQAYLALSPSLWRSDRAVMADIPDFGQRLSRRHDDVRFFVGVGGREETVPATFGDSITQDELATEIQYCRMIRNVADLTRQVQPYFKANRLPFASTVFPSDSHNSVPWTAVNPALDFAFPPVVSARGLPPIANRKAG